MLANSLSDSTQMTIRIPRSELSFAKKYAARGGQTLTQLVRGYFHSLAIKESEEEIPLEVSEIAGCLLSPTGGCALAKPMDEYADYILAKHSR